MNTHLRGLLLGGGLLVLAAVASPYAVDAVTDLHHGTYVVGTTAPDGAETKPAP